MKKIIRVILAGLMIALPLIMSGCGGGDGASDAPRNANGTLSVSRAESEKSQDTGDVLTADDGDDAEGGKNSADGDDASSQHTYESPDFDYSGEVVEIGEKLFLTQVNDIYANINKYFDKTIKYEGIFLSDDYEGTTYYYVIRYGPGCCGNDGDVGFEVVWDGKIPPEKAWVQVSGKLETYVEDDAEYVHLRLSDMTQIETRGKENVTQ